MAESASIGALSCEEWIPMKEIKRESRLQQQPMTITNVLKPLQPSTEEEKVPRLVLCSTISSQSLSITKAVIKKALKLLSEKIFLLMKEAFVYDSNGLVSRLCSVNEGSCSEDVAIEMFMRADYDAKNNSVGVFGTYDIAKTNMNLHIASLHLTTRKRSMHKKTRGQVSKLYIEEAVACRTRYFFFYRYG